MNDKKIIYKDLSYKIVGCMYEVFNTLGPGHKEEIYHQALCVEFANTGIKFGSKKKVSIKYDGQDIGTYEPDFIIDDKVIIEIKSTKAIPAVFEKQLYYYLNTTGYKLGFLVNFGTTKIDIKRRVM